MVMGTHPSTVSLVDQLLSISEVHSDRFFVSYKWGHPEGAPWMAGPNWPRGASLGGQDPPSRVPDRKELGINISPQLPAD